MGSIPDKILSSQASPNGKASPSDVEFYSDLISKSEAAANPLDTILNSVVGTNSTQAAQASKVGQQIGVPSSVAARNMDQAAQQARVKQLKAILARNSVLAEQMRNPEFAALAHEDAEGLADLEHKTRTVGETLGDIGVTAWRGGLAASQAVIGLADLVTLTPGYVGQQLSDIGIDPSAEMDRVSQYFSPETQRAQKKVADAKGITKTIQALFENPSTLAINIGESLPSMVLGGMFGAGAAGLLPGMASKVAGALGEGFIQMGQSAEQSRSGTDDGLLTYRQVYAALASGTMDTALSMLGGTLAQHLGVEDLDVLVTGRRLSPGSRKMLGRKVLEGGITEGFFEELPQGIQEQMLQNYAENRPIFEGVSQAAVLGTFAGVVMGGGANLVSGVADRGSRANAALLDAATSIESTRLMQNSPETLAEYAQRVGDKHGISTVYLQADRAVEVALKNGMTPEQIPGWLAGYGVTEAQLQTELQSGGKLELNYGPAVKGLASDPVIQALGSEILIRASDVSKSGRKNAQENEAEHLAHLDELYQADQANKITTDDIDAWKQAILDKPELKKLVQPEMLQLYTAKANALHSLRPEIPAIEHLNRLLQPWNVQVTKHAEFAKTHPGAVMQKTESPNVDSPEFKAWFGDSKVVDESGLPLVVSHVSPGRFKKFDKKLGWHYFTDSQAYLEQVKNARGLLEDKPLVQRDFYLNLRNPLDLRSLGEKTTTGEFNSFLASKGIDLSVIYGPYATEVIKPGGALKTTAILIAEQREFRDEDFTRAFKEAGYDGAILPDYLDPSMDRGITDRVAATSYAVFDPTQIKSVNNQGAFNPNDPNIYHQESVVDKFAQAVENQAKVLYQVHTVNAWEKNVEQWMDDNEVPTKRRKEIRENLLAAKALANTLEEVKDLFPHNTMWNTRNEKGKLPSPVRDNSDMVLYIKSLDLSASCVKRLEYGANLIELYRVLGRTPTADDAMLMVVRMREAGKEAPCVYCYVESPRRAFAEEATRFAGILAGEVPLNKPAKPEEQEKYKRDKAMVKSAKAAGFKLSDFDVTPFLTDQAQSPHAEQFKEFYAWIRGKAQASSNQNAVKTYVDYSGQILKLAGMTNKSTDNIPFKDWINQRAGMRIFSTSDFQIEHVYDLLQAVVDMNAAGMKAHAYTKQPSFVRIFGATGIKIQMSVFATETNGEFTPDTAMGMGWTEAQQLREKYGNAGTVMVTTSDAMTKWAMEQDWIDFIIPFHASGMPKAFFSDALNWQNFTSTQNEKSLTGDPIRKTIMQEFAGIKGKTLPQLTKAYLALCEERGIRPVFSQYQFTENGKVNPNFAKLRKDYARTDTPFAVPDPRKVDMDAMKELLDEYIANGGRNVQADSGIVAKVAAEIKAGTKGRDALAESDLATRSFLARAAAQSQESFVAEPSVQGSIIASDGGVTYVSETEGLDANAGSSSSAGNLGAIVYTPYEAEDPLSKAYVKKSPTGKMLSAISTIKSPADAAHVAFPLTSKAQENLVAIVTTKTGKILGVVQHTTGSINQSMANTRDLLGVIHDFPGAAKVWLAHNHPSGDPTTSPEDAGVSIRVRQILKGSGMSYQGMLAVGASGGAAWINPVTDISETISLADLRATDQRAKRISTYDREIVSLPETSPIWDSKSVLKVIRSLKGEASGIMILSTRNYPVAFVPMTQAEMIHLRTGDVATGSSAIMQAFHRSNGAVMIVTAPELRVDAVRNLVSFGHILGAKVLDGIDSHSGKSFQENSSLPKARETFYQSAWHGSPHKFDKFSTSKIGTGEGAQAYGYGLYFAGSKEVAEYYKDTLSEKPDRYLLNGKDVLKLYEQAEQENQYDKLTIYEAILLHQTPEAIRETFSVANGYTKAQAALANTLTDENLKPVNEKGEEVSRGHLYKVELIPAEEDYLDWNKTWGEQSDRVKESLDKLGVGKIVRDLVKRELLSPSYKKLATLTGGDIYEALRLNEDPAGTRWQNAAKFASNTIHESGIRGIRYKADSPGEESYNYVIFSDDDVTIEEMYQRQKNQDPYAALSQTASGENIISLFEKANRSSFLHETGHIFLNDLKYVAENLAIQTEEWTKVKSWLGVGADGVITTPMHEKFADHFEVYLKTGQAPTTELRNAFRKFKKWLTQIYDIARGKNGRDLSDIQINPEIKDLFDRLLATEQEIKAEQEQAALIAMLDDKLLNESNFTPEQIAEYKKIVDQSYDAAIESRDKHKLVGRDERVKEWKKQATDEAAKRPVYAFQEKMREKISRASIVDQFGEEDVPDNSPMYGADGADINIAIAENGKEFGYESAGAFVGDLRSAPPKAQWIQKRMAQLESQYNGQQDTQDAIRTSSLKRQLEIESQFLAKQAAKANEAQDKKQKEYEQRWKDAEAKLEEAIREGQQEAELQKLRDQIAALKAEKAAGAKAFREAKPIPAFALDIWARNIVRGRTLSEIQNIGKMLVESKRHRQEALKATRKGQWDEALKANEKARMTEELIRASYQAQRQWKSIETRWKKIAKWTNDNKNVKVGEKFRDQINRVLSQYSIAQREFNADARDIHSFVESLAENELESAATSIADWIGIETNGYNKISWEQIQDLDDALKFLYGKGREEVEGLKTSWGKKITEVADEILAAQIDVKNLPNLASDATRIGRVVQGIQKNYRKFFAQTGILRFIARRMDGYMNIGGSGTMGPAERIVQRVINGMAKSNDRWAAISAKIEPLLKVLTQDSSTVFGDLRLPQKFQQYGMSWTKERVVVACLNMGNDSNLQRLRDGYGLSDSDIKAIQGKLTAEEWGAIQKIWKELATLWPEIADVHERMNFFRPKQLEIQPLTVQTADGQSLELDGGYYPVSYDKGLDREIAKWTEKDDLMASHQAVLQKPVAKSGFTKGRAEEVTRPIKLSLANLGTHFNDTIRYITLAEAIKDADRVFQNGKLVDRNIQTIGRDLQDMITPALKNTLRPEQRDLGIFERGRVGMSMFYMGYNAWTALQNITGIFPMIRQAGFVNYLNGSFHLLKSGPWQAHKAMLEASGYMRLRGTNIERDMKSQLRNFNVGGIEINGKQYGFDDVKSLGFAGIRMIDSAVSLPAWWGKYNAEMESHGDIQKATEAADAAVNAALGSGLAIDVNAIGRHPFLSLLAPFMSFAATQQEVLATEKAAWRSGKISGGEYLYGVMMTVVFPAIASTFLQGVLMYGLAGAVGGGDDDRKEKGVSDYLTDLLSYRLMGIPFIRDVYNATVQGVERKAPVTSARMPVTEAFKMLQQLAYRIGNMDGSERSVKATMWSLAEIASLASGIPASRIYDRWMKGTQDIENGEGWFGNHFIPQERKK